MKSFHLSGPKFGIAEEMFCVVKFVVVEFENTLFTKSYQKMVQFLKKNEKKFHNCGGGGWSGPYMEFSIIDFLIFFKRTKYGGIQLKNGMLYMNKYRWSEFSNCISGYKQGWRRGKCFPFTILCVQIMHSTHPYLTHHLAQYFIVKPWSLCWF